METVYSSAGFNQPNVYNIHRSNSALQSITPSSSLHTQNAMATSFSNHKSNAQSYQALNPGLQKKGTIESTQTTKSANQ